MQIYLYLINTNLSLSSGIIPNELKAARLNPVFKTGKTHINLITIDQSAFYLLFLKYSKNVCTTNS